MKWAVVVLALATVVGLGVLMIQRATELNCDFITYRAAGWAVLTGSDIYEVQNPRGWPYVYPPRDGVGLCRVAEGVSVDGHLAASSMT